VVAFVVMARAIIRVRERIVRLETLLDREQDR